MIRPAEERDVEKLNSALEALSRELGDTHRAGPVELRSALFGSPPSTWAHLAQAGEGLAGVVLYSPIFSTVRGGAGVFVSDIWVASTERGRGLGGVLLRKAAESGSALWGSVFMRLSVHDNNRKARAFYSDLGFQPVGGETVMVLTGSDFQSLRRSR